MPLNDRSSLLSHLATRRSTKPRNLVAPGPDAAQIAAILAAAARTPDHGKLAPWRFVTVADRAGFAALLQRAYAAANPAASEAECGTVDAFAHQAPCLIVVVAHPDPASKIPVWEQHLSVGAAAMNLLHAAHAHGFVGGWITGWASYDPQVVAAFAQAPDDRIAGFMFIGTPDCALEERPRPHPDAVSCVWVAPH